jgi:biopolymer transport protein ExbB
VIQQFDTEQYLTIVKFFSAMRKLIALMLVIGLTALMSNVASAQDGTGQTQGNEQPTTAQPATAEPATIAAPAPADAGSEGSQPGAFQVLKEKYIEGGWIFMTPILFCLILGLAFAIERVITLSIATTNTDKLLARIDDNLKTGNIAGAMEVCKTTQGPTASVLYEGLRASNEGPAAVEKSIVSYGSVQMGLLEKGLVWISLFIALAPMLGFLGTVIGMVGAFDRIEAAGDISPTIVAGGIKVALLTTVFGLISAIILQVFYNYIVSKIDNITNKMEDASIALVDVMAANNVFNK